MSARLRIDALAARAVLALPSLLLAGVVAVAAWRVAGWVWVFAPPPAVVAPDRQSADGASVAAGRHWFGEAAGATTLRGVPGPAAATAPGGLRLVGVISGGKRPAALFADGRSQFEVLLGESFGNGQVLRQVAADHVLVVQGGAPTRVELEGAAAGPGAGTPASPPAATPRSDPAARVPPPATQPPGRPADRPARQP